MKGKALARPAQSPSGPIPVGVLGGFDRCRERAAKQRYVIIRVLKIDAHLAMRKSATHSLALKIADEAITGGHLAIVSEHPEKRIMLGAVGHA